MKLELVTFFSVVLNIISLALGVSVLTCAVWILFDNGTLLTGRPSDVLYTVGVGMMVIGILVVITSVLGCFATVRKFKMLLLVCMGFLVVLILGQIFIFTLVTLNRFKIENEVDKELFSLMMNYTENGTRNDLIDEIQRNEKCCGSNGSSIWQKNEYIQNFTSSLWTQSLYFPCSCFNMTISEESLLCKKTPKTQLFKEGCTEKVKNWVFENIVTIVAMIAGLMLLQMIIFGLMACLYNSDEQEEEQKKPLVPADQETQDPVQTDKMPHGQQNNGHTGAADRGGFNPVHEDELPYRQQNNGYIDADDHGDFDSVHEDELPYGKQNFGYMDADEDDIDQDHPSHVHGYRGPKDGSTTMF